MCHGLSYGAHGKVVEVLKERKGKACFIMILMSLIVVYGGFGVSQRNLEKMEFSMYRKN